MTESDLTGESRKKIEALEREIRRLKKVQTELAESEEKYRLLVENANDAIFIVQDGRVHFPNQKGREMGRQLELDLDNVPFIEYVHPDDQELVIDRHLRRLRGEDLPHVYTFRIIGGNGDEITVALNAVLINWQGRQATLNFLRDITVQKALESQLHQARKLEALGTMAGGMAHDFNNLLMSIRADASAIHLGNHTTERQQSMLDGILHAVSSGEAMTKKLLGFSREDTCELSVTDMNLLVSQTIELFKRSHRGLRIQTDFQPQLWSVDADPVQLERVLLNLMVNAGQAMPGGGCLRLSTRNETIGWQQADHLNLAPGQYVQIRVADNGPGMDESILKHIFDPFFTTKAKGQGTGLGLSCSFGIVKSHHGNLVASSRKGDGAQFDIYLPVSEMDACSQNDNHNKLLQDICLPPELDWLRTVLLVDDNRLFLTAVTLMLEKQGLQVLSAMNAASALDLLSEQGNTIDLVILDMILPNMGGEKAFNQMREINPTARFMLTSGCGADDTVCQLLHHSGVGFIQKPYGEEELYQKIKEISA